jgi:probable HAF family extracellular repeat protein
LGTLGGSFSFAIAINNKGQVIGFSETDELDPNTGFPFVHGFLWEDGVLTDLGTLGGPNSFAIAINERGQIVGQAETPDADPNFGFPILHSFLWQDGVMTDLEATLGGNHTYGIDINNRSQVVGSSDISTEPRTEPDFFGHPYAFHANVWDKGVVTELGTFGGDSSEAQGINSRDQVVGFAYTPELYPNLGFQIPHAFLWDKGVLTDLGTLGGNVSLGLETNEKGQVIGWSETSEVDPNSGFPFIHAFVWEDGVMIDLGTLGGNNSFVETNGINNRGQVVGGSETAEVDPNGFPIFHAYLWEDGTMTDLNSRIPADSGWEQINALGINDRGQIVGFGLINGQSHASILTPTNCNSGPFNSSPTLLTKSKGNGISAASLQQYRSLLGKAGLRVELPWLQSNLKTGIWKPK